MMMMKFIGSSSNLRCKMTIWQYCLVRTNNQAKKKKNVSAQSAGTYTKNVSTK